MQKITWLVLFFLVLSLPGWALAQEGKPRHSNFLYGTDTQASPDFIKAAKWFNALSDQIKSLIKKIIGVRAFNQIARAWNNMTSSVGSFFSKMGKMEKFEWKIR